MVLHFAYPSSVPFQLSCGSTPDSTVCTTPASNKAVLIRYAMARSTDANPVQFIGYWFIGDA